MAAYIKNTLYVRNLSPQVSEQTLREFFAQCGEIEQITFKSFNTLSKQFFAQVDFEASSGVSEGSKLNGTTILGVPCVVGVIDPLLQPKSDEQGDGAAMDEAAYAAEFAKRQKEAEDDQRFRTVHIANIGYDMSYEHVRTLCASFGEVEKLRIDEDDYGQRFALCEYKERGPAHVCKQQRQFIHKGKVLVFTEAQTFVDACSFMERSVQFEDRMLNIMAMKSVLSQQTHLKSKLDQVRIAAESILPDKEKPQWGGGAALALKDSTQKKDKKEKKDKKDKKEKKARKSDGGQEGAAEGQDNEGKRQKREKKSKGEKKSSKDQRSTKRRKEDGGRDGSQPSSPNHKKRRRKEGKSEDARKKKRQPKNQKESSRSDSEKPERPEMVEDESDGPIDLDEVEVVENTEFVVMPSSSSSSTTDSSDERERNRVVDLDANVVVTLEDGVAQVSDSESGS
mmetsp:Transcript_59683/g.134500  ORF Transcript_59683/g.134500 Transcript_59683/m.134500 type:complete len:452 (-) Transcript_59683:243-1598(-)